MELRCQYNLNEGDLLTLVDLGEGTFILVPQVSQVAAQGDRVARTLAEEHVLQEDMLLALEEERERYYQEHYAKE